jgi:outer membrane protein insertion porin family
LKEKNYQSKLAGNRLLTDRAPQMLKPSHCLIIYTSLVFLLLTGSAASQSDQSIESPHTLVVESIEISGNSMTDHQIILSFLSFRSGDHINKIQLEKDSRRLQDSHFFKEVNVYTQPGTDRGQVILYIEVKERSWPYFQFKGGFSELDGWYLSPIGLRFDNLFGHGNYAGIEFFIGDRLTGLDISYLKPDLFSTNLNFRLLLYTRGRQFVHYQEGQKYLQRVDNGGLGLRLNSNQGLMKYLWFDFVVETFTAGDYMWKAGEKEVEVELPAELQPYSGKNGVGRLVVSLNVDTRNQITYPSHGYWGSLAIDQVRTQQAVFDNYDKWIFDLRGYQEISHHWVLAVRAKAAWTKETAPFYDRYYLGGPNSLRGYADRSLNPVDYASRLIQGSAELRFPLTQSKYPGHFLTGVFFYDLGQAWSAPDTYDENKFHSSVGYGLRFNIPFIGLLRLDFAYPVPTYDLMVHLSLGHTF